MGQDKALLRLGSMNLMERARMTLAGAGLDVWIAGARNPELAMYAPVIPDEWEDAGPLGGVSSALRHTDRTFGAFVTVDQPLMAPALVMGLLDHARTTGSPVTVASLKDDPQTFPAVVRRDALAALEAELDARRRGCIAAFRVAGLQLVAAEEIAAPEALPHLEKWFWNVNTPEDFAKVESTFPEDYLRECRDERRSGKP